MVDNFFLSDNLLTCKVLKLIIIYTLLTPITENRLFYYENSYKIVLFRARIILQRNYLRWITGNRKGVWVGFCRYGVNLQIIEFCEHFI